MNIVTLLLAALLFSAPALAGPGAHGPNGEHLDAPGAHGAASAVPRFETFTESFELVGQLSGGELSITVDRYDTNEPVLGGELEVQYKNLKAKARFHADMGDYAVDDPKLLAVISQPGSHPLLFTFVAGEESDLLEATLQVSEAGHEEHDDHATSRPWLLAAVAAAVLIAAVLLVRRFRRRKEA